VAGSGRKWQEVTEKKKKGQQCTGLEDKGEESIGQGCTNDDGTTTTMEQQRWHNDGTTTMYQW